MTLRYTILFRNRNGLVWARLEEDLDEALKVLSRALEDDGHTLDYRDRQLSPELEQLLLRPGEHAFPSPDLSGSTVIKAHK